MRSSLFVIALHACTSSRVFCFAATLCTVTILILSGCQDQHPSSPEPTATLPTALHNISIALRVDLVAQTITPVSTTLNRSASVDEVSNSFRPSYALLGTNELGVATSNLTRSATGAFTPRQQRVRFDIALTNQLAGAAFVTPTFPAPPAGQTSLMLVPFAISHVLGTGDVAVSTDWNGDGTAGSGEPHSFFNDVGCSTKKTTVPSDCYRWEGFPSPLNPGATTGVKRVGFDIAPTVQSFVVEMVLAADLADAAVSEGKIAFVRGVDGINEIFVMNADGSDVTRITDNRSDDTFPAWSPDGSKIVFSSNRDGNFEIYVMNADGTGATRLTTDDAEDSSPDWSPDGTKIVFHSFRNGLANAEIYVMNADGSGTTRLTTNTLNDLQPDWSPDGSKIVFISFRDTTHEIYVMNADGTVPTKLTANGQGFGYDFPDWSPDGSKIAFQSSLDGMAQIYVMNADGSGTVKLTNTVPNSAPVWSPDGSRIAFIRVYSDNFGTVNDNIYVMHADGTHQAQRTNGSIDLFPAWSR